MAGTGGPGRGHLRNRRPPSEDQEFRDASHPRGTPPLTRRRQSASAKPTPEPPGCRNAIGRTDPLSRRRGLPSKIARITQGIFDSFERPQPGRAALALLDFQRAYDRVWRAALLAKLARLQVPAHTIAWINGFLSDRRARVRWETAASRRKVFQEGGTQCWLRSCLLWLVYMNDIDDDMPADVEVSLYADDVAIISTDRTLQGCSAKLQSALDTIDAWTERWKVLPSINKCPVTYFTLNPKETRGKATPAVTLRGEQLRHELRPTFLGVTLDDQLTFSDHI